MHSAKLILSLILMSFIISCSSNNADKTTLNSKTIRGIPGPEDIVLDLKNTRQRLLVSGCERRTWLEPKLDNGIYQVDIENNETNVLNRIGEPQNFLLHPHGIELVEKKNGEQLLYVIAKGNNNFPPSIVVYLLENNNLYFKQQVIHDYIFSPNALKVYPDGSMYIANDNGGNWIKDIIFKSKKSTIVHFDGKSNWNVVAGKIGGAAGIETINNKLYVSAFLEDSIYEFDIKSDWSLSGKRKIANLPGPDNISLNNEDIIVSANKSGLELFNHFKDPAEISPSNIWSISTKNNEVKEIFYDDGSTISASTVGVIHKNNLYIGQVMNHFILKVNLE